MDIRIESELVLQAQAGDVQAFERLVDRVVPSLVRFLRNIVREHETAEDVAQVALLRAHRNLKRLRDPQRFRGWLWRIARCAAVDSLRREHRRPHLIQAASAVDEALDDRPEDTAPVDLRYEYDALMDAVRGIVNDSPESARTLLVMRYERGCSYVEMAEELGVSLVCVKARLARARCRLHGRLAPLEEEWNRLRDEVS